MWIGRERSDLIAIVINIIKVFLHNSLKISLKKNKQQNKLNKQQKQTKQKQEK
jgi:hypothetical protein